MIENIILIAIIGLAVLFLAFYLWARTALAGAVRVVDSDEFKVYRKALERFVSDYCELDTGSKDGCKIPSELDALDYFMDGYQPYEAAICWRDDRRIRPTKDRAQPHPD